MSFETYDDLFEVVSEQYTAQKYRETLDLLDAEGAKFPEHASMIAYLRSCMAARIGLPEHAIQILSEAVARGFWYGAETIRQTPSWISLQGDPEFERLAAVCFQRQLEAVKDPKMYILGPDELGPYPLFFALHGNGDNSMHTLYGWNNLIDIDWILAAPQSAQAESSDGYVWNNQSAALRQLVQQFADVGNEYQVDPERIILAGFSMGGETALRLALIGPIEARGFVLLGPGGPTIDDPEEWLPEIREAKGRNLRGYILVGEHDRTIPHDQIKRMVKLLNDNGIPCELEIIPGLRHAYPSNTLEYLQRAFNFIGVA
jgi:pimeloyl-ACP methyl ester carboxylesterase